MDRLATRTDALNRQESFTYDPAGNLRQFTDRKNQQSTFGYDSLNRRIGANYANGRTRTFAYDAVGQLVRAVDSVTGALEFAYDALNRLIKEVGPKGVVTYVYDALGRRTAMTSNGAQPVSYQYDAASRLTQVVQGTQTVGLGYDAAGRRTSLTYPNGTNTSYGYDNASRLTNIVHNGPSGVIESLTYTYDAAGNRISLIRTNGTATLLPAAVQAAYDAANQQIQFNAASPNQTFDANGNLTFDGVNTYTWDALNQLEAISGPGLSASFGYDALGRRISKTINGVTTSYLYDGNDIVQEIGGSAVGASYVRSLNIDDPFIRQTTTGNEFYHTDALGSTLALSNAGGASAVSYSYEAFGKTTITGGSANAFQFTGRENDGTGLYYYRARYYSLSLGRYISQDPIGLDGGINEYVYARNNPTTFKDPLGLKVDRKQASARLNSAIDEVRRSPKGRQLYDELERRKETYYFRDMRPDDPLDRCQNQTACYNRKTREIVVDTDRPGFPVEGIPSSVERRVGHEMSHGVNRPGAEDQAQTDDSDIVEYLGLPELRWPGH